MVVPGRETFGTRRVKAVSQWPLRGGAACLDFANTVGWRPAPRPFDGLKTYDDLLAWSRHVGLLTSAAFDRLRAGAVDDPRAATETLAAAVSLREAIHRLFLALAHGRDWAEDDLATITVWLADGLSRSALAAANGGFVFRAPEDERALALPLWIVAESAARLLLTGDWRRVRECPGHDCGWLFLDQTKNGNRRWCDSADCGNRARVAAHQQRKRERAGRGA